MSKGSVDTIGMLIWRIDCGRDAKSVATRSEWSLTMKGVENGVSSVRGIGVRR